MVWSDFFWISFAMFLAIGASSCVTACFQALLHGTNGLLDLFMMLDRTMHDVSQLRPSASLTHKMLLDLNKRVEHMEVEVIQALVKNLTTPKPQPPPPDAEQSDTE